MKQNYLDTLVEWIQQEVKKSNAKGVIVGISGGIDSALVSVLAKRAFPNNFLALMMPINRNRKFDLEDGIELAQKFDINYRIIDLYDEYNLLRKKLKIDSNLIDGNLQARLRMATLYAFAQKNNYLVLGTDNKAEYELGYFTKYGDGGCDLLPIVHLYKSQVFKYAKEIGVTEAILNKAPSAGLWDDQSDEKELGFSYDEFEKFDKGLLEDKILQEKIKKQIKTR